MIDLNPLGGFGSREHLGVIDSPVAVLVELSAQPHGLRGGSGDFKIAAFDDVGVDTFATRYVDHLIDGLVEQPLPGDDAVAAMSFGQQLAATRRQACQPASVAAGGAEPGEARLEDRDPQ